MQTSQMLLLALQKRVNKNLPQLPEGEQIGKIVH